MSDWQTTGTVADSPSAVGNYIDNLDVDNWPEVPDATETFATTDVDISTDKITVTNDIPTGAELRLSSTGVLPDPMVAGTVYYAIRVDATHIQVATTAVNAAAGTQIDLTDVGSGIHTLDIGSGSSSTDRQAVIDRAEQLIENLTKDYFYSKAFVIYRNGNGQNHLVLNLQPNILTVTEILVRGVALETSWWTYDASSVYLDPESATGGIDDPELLLRLERKHGLFPPGMNNIKITGTYGWSACPAAIKQAAVILCRYENDETLYTAYDDVVSDKLADAGYSRGTKKFLTGIHEADRLLRSYIRHKPLLGAI